MHLSFYTVAALFIGTSRLEMFYLPLMEKSKLVVALEIDFSCTNMLVANLLHILFFIFLGSCQLLTVNSISFMAEIT